MVPTALHVMPQLAYVRQCMTKGLHVAPNMSCRVYTMLMSAVLRLAVLIACTATGVIKAGLHDGFLDCKPIQIGDFALLTEMYVHPT